MLVTCLNYKSAKMGPKNNKNAVKNVNERVDQLSSEFHANLEEFKIQFLAENIPNNKVDLG